MTPRITLLAAVGLLLLPAFAYGQIVTPVLPLPPCQGHNCLVKERGATTDRSQHPSQRTPCPLGTKYDPQKGTCKVMPAR